MTEAQYLAELRKLTDKIEELLQFVRVQRCHCNDFAGASVCRRCKLLGEDNRIARTISPAVGNV